MNDAARETVRGTIGLIVSKEWEILDATTRGKGMSGKEVERALDEYGRTFVRPPAFVWDDLDAVHVASQSAETWDVRFDLWTAEEGRSDLQVQMTVREVRPGVQLYDVEIDNVLVP